MRHPRVGMPGDHGIHRPSRNVGQHFENLLVAITARQVVGVLKIFALAADVRSDHDDLRPGSAHLFGLLDDRAGDWRHFEAEEVGGHGSHRRGLGAHTNDADLDARNLDNGVRWHVWPIDARTGLLVEDVGSQQREVRFGRAHLQRTPRILTRAADDDGGTHRTEIEFVIAHRCGGVAHRVVGRDHRRAFVAVGFERSLEHVASIDQHHGATVGRAL